MLALLAGGLVAAACSDGGERQAGVIRVPAEAPTIAKAVARARTGDLVLVADGVYTESLTLTASGITVRGVSRNGVVIDGGGVRANGIVVNAAGISIENLTVRNHLVNGVLVTSERFAVRYVTAHNNGLYGVYAFGSRHGVIEHSYASGHPDAGLYVGRCSPCDVVVRDNTAERNAIGYEGTNASRDVLVVRNRFSRNRVGMTTNTEPAEGPGAQSQATIAGNLIRDNAEAQSPSTAEGGFGAGIVVSGGTGNLVARNRVTGHPGAGILLGSHETQAPVDNTVSGNVVMDNGIDLAYAPAAAAPGQGNCFADNEAARSQPADLPTAFACPARPGIQSVGAVLNLLAAPSPGVAFRDVPLPPAQPDMPGDVDRPPPGLPEHFAAAEEVDAVTVPAPGYTPPGTVGLPLP